MLIKDHDLWVNYLPSHWIKVPIYLKMSNNLLFFIGEATLENYRLVHQLVRDSTEQVVRHFHLLNVFFRYLLVELLLYFLEGFYALLLFLKSVLGIKINLVTRKTIHILIYIDFIDH